MGCVSLPLAWQHDVSPQRVGWLSSLFFANRASYPDRKEGEDAEMDEELPEDKNLEYDDDTLELTLPSGELSFLTFFIYLTNNRKLCKKIWVRHLHCGQSYTIHITKNNLNFTFISLEFLNLVIFYINCVFLLCMFSHTKRSVRCASYITFHQMFQLPLCSLVFNCSLGLFFRIVTPFFFRC